MVAERGGGFYLNLGGEKRLFSPHVALFIQDSIEGYLLCGQRCSPGTAYPCRYCWIPKDASNDPYAMGVVRTAGSNRLRSRKWRHQLQALPKGSQTPGEVTKGLTALSLNPVRNGTWDAPFGVEDRGINGAAVPDMLHQYLLGLLKSSLEYTKLAIAWHGRQGREKGTLSKSQRMQTLDMRFQNFTDRHAGAHLCYITYRFPSDSVSLLIADPTMPRKRFSSGVSNVSHITASEFIPLCWQMTVVLGVGEDEVKGGKILPKGERLKIVKVFHDLMSLREDLWAEEHSETDLQELERRIPV